jgi:pyrroline-5-carboxylate reductase
MGDYKYPLGIIGGGAMGGALAKALVARGALTAAQVLVADPRPAALQALSEGAGLGTTGDNASVVALCETVVLAVKPQMLAEVVAPLRFAPGQLVVSIAAGVSLGRLAELIGAGQPVVRVMPNLLVTVAECASAYAVNEQVSEAQQARVAEWLGQVGSTVAVAEPLLDAVTGLSGSGPAFVAVFLEALVDGGVMAGLPRAQALQLAAQTMAGVGRWVLENQASPALLKDQVTSPAGTTIAGLQVLEEHGLRGAAFEAVVTAARRSRELGQQ